MIAGLSLQDLALTVQREAASHRDFLVSSSSLVVEPADRGIVMGFDTSEDRLLVTPTGHAHSQMAERLKIPQRYYDRMLTSAPDLLATNLNHWLRADTKTQLLRTRINGLSWLRAFLSNRYRRIDNIDLLAAILPFFAMPGWEVKSAQVTAQRLYLQVVSTLVKGEIRPGDIVQAGVVVSNSEIGSGRIAVEGLQYRCTCSNGMVTGNGLRRSHIGRTNLFDEEEAFELYSDDTKKLDDAVLFMKLRDVIAAAIDVTRFEESLEKQRAAAQRRLPENVPSVVEVTAKRHGLNEAEQSSVLMHLAAGGDLTHFGLVNAVTRSAQDNPDYDRAVELQRVGGMILDDLPNFSAN